MQVGSEAEHAAPPIWTGRFIPLNGLPVPNELPNWTRLDGPWSPPGPKISNVIPARSIVPKGRSKPGNGGIPAIVPIEAPAPELPPAAANAMYSASKERSGRAGLKVALNLEFSAVAYPVAPGKKTPIPPTNSGLLSNGLN